MVIQNLLLANESYTHKDWVYKNVCVSFSHIYYVLDGEAYYEEDGVTHPLKKGHLYITPVKKPFNLYDNPNNQLLHTLAHAIIMPSIENLLEYEVMPNTPLADAVALWRKYTRQRDYDMIKISLQFLLSCIGTRLQNDNKIARMAKEYLDHTEDFTLSMDSLSRELGYNKDHITRNFSNEYHMTPKQYFNSRRMDIAATMLRDGHKVGEIANFLNYASVYSFSKAFKNHFGMSPEKYLPVLHLNTKVE